MMSKKRKITKEMLLSATGRKPSQPELPSLNTTQARELVEKYRGRYPAIAKGVFRFKNPQVQQIPRSDLVNMDYATIERRVVAVNPALGAPYDPANGIDGDAYEIFFKGQTDKDNSDEQQID